jgi:ribonuclease BN (tRNA processing enzyme)
VDFGYGTLHQLLRLGISYHDIDRIFFTHNHPDHMCDLILFLFGSRYKLDPRTKDLEIVAAPGFKQFFDGVTAAFNHWLIPTTYKISIVSQDEETRDHDSLSVTTRKVKHIELSRGYRFQDRAGKTVVVSGDTDYCEGIVVLGKNADLLILECAFPDEGKVKGHLTPRLAGKVAREAGCKKLCLTHLYPTCEPDEALAHCREEFSGDIVLAQDLMEFNL